MSPYHGAPAYKKNEKKIGNSGDQKLHNYIYKHDYETIQLYALDINVIFMKINI